MNYRKRNLLWRRTSPYVDTFYPFVNEFKSKELTVLVPPIPHFVPYLFILLMFPCINLFAIFRATSRSIGAVWFHVSINKVMVLFFLIISQWEVRTYPKGGCAKMVEWIVVTCIHHSPWDFRKSPTDIVRSRQLSRVKAVHSFNPQSPLPCGNIQRTPSTKWPDGDRVMHSAT